MNLELLHLVEEKLRLINTNKEKLITAWIAETGLLPSQSMLVIRDLPDGCTQVWVEATTPTDRKFARDVMRPHRKSRHRRK